MKVLIACEESQRVCTEFRKLGHEAYSADIQEPSGNHPEWHILGDVLNVLNGGEFSTMDNTSHKVDKWDLIIAHPPCTYLSNAGARWLFKGGKLNQERYEKGLGAKKFFMEFYNAACEKIAIENPVPSRVYNLPEKTQIIEPYMFGHPVTKKTCLWLKGIEPLKPTNNVGKPKTTYMKRKDGTFRANCWEMINHGSKDRSKTFEGIAKAMAEQWGGKRND